MNYERKEDLNQVDADPCSLPGDLSILDELFPSLGDGGSSSNHFTNQLAFLLNSFNSNEEDGASNGPPLFNPLQLSPPRLNEIHALATANLISQTQEAIMQEYNITDLDFESTNSPVKGETRDRSSSNTVEDANTNVDKPMHKIHSESDSKTLNSNVIVSDCSFTNLHSCAAEDEVAAKFVEREASQDEGIQSNVPLLMKTCESTLMGSSVIKSEEAMNVAQDSDCFQNDAYYRTVDKKSHMTVTLSSIIKNHQKQGKGFLEIPLPENSNQKMLASSNENPLNDKIMLKEYKSNVMNGTSHVSLDCVSRHCTLSHKLNEAEQTLRINGPNMEPDQLKKQLLKFEQNRDCPLESSNFKNGICNNGDSTKGSKIHIMCMKCLKHFNCVEHLEQHKMNHQQYVCPFPGCIRTFAYRSHLSYHRKVHEKEKSYQCSECGKLFTNSQHLDVHMRTHNDSKPYVCSVCNKCFTTIGNLKNHSRLHTGERPYACDFNGCDKRFVELSSLKKHKVVHTGEKSYQCDICGKSFTQVSSQKYHMKKHKETKILKGTKADSVKS